MATYPKHADEVLTTTMVESQHGFLIVAYEAVTAGPLMDFLQGLWSSPPERQKMIGEFIAEGPVHSTFLIFAHRIPSLWAIQRGVRSIRKIRKIEMRGSGGSTEPVVIGAWYFLWHYIDGYL
ncbi:protein of unknown function [Serratia sp. Tan611]|nr:protein of unknown function [Serratia sp. Tan611]